MFSDTPLDYPLEFTAGATFRKVFGVSVNGVAWDMTGWTSLACVRLTDVHGVPLAGVPQLQATSTYDAVGKTWTLDFPTAVSALLLPSVGLPMSIDYVWDWKLTSLGPAFDIYVPLAGLVTVGKKVS